MAVSATKRSGAQQNQLSDLQELVIGSFWGDLFIVLYVNVD
jgi:hypothetical protein